MTVYLNQLYASIANVPSAFQPVNVEDYIPAITQTDITSGIITRYFARQVNMLMGGPITEIDPTLASSINTNVFWKVVSLDWRISGPLNDVTSSGGLMQPVRLATGVITANKISLGIAEAEMPGMQYKILNYAQFYTPRASVQGVPPAYGFAPPLDPPLSASVVISATASYFALPNQLPTPMLIVPTQEIRASTGSGAAPQTFAPQPVNPPPASRVEFVIPPGPPPEITAGPVIFSSSISSVSVYGKANIPQLSKMSVSSSIVQVRPSTNANPSAPTFMLSSSIGGTQPNTGQPSIIVTLTSVQITSTVNSASSVIGNAFIPTASTKEVSAIGQVLVSTQANTTTPALIVVSSSIPGAAAQGLANTTTVISVVISSSIVPVTIGASSASAPFSVTIAPTSLFLTNSIQSAFTATVRDQYSNPLAYPVFWSSQFPTYVFVSSSAGIVQALIGGQTSIITATVSGTNITGSATVTTAAPVATFLNIAPTQSIIYSGSYGNFNVVSASSEIFSVVQFDQYDNVIPCGVSSSVPQTLVVTPLNVVISSSIQIIAPINITGSTPFVLTTVVTNTQGQIINVPLNFISSNTASVSVNATGTLLAHSGSQTASITVSVPNTSLSEIVTVTTTTSNPLLVNVNPMSATETAFGSQTIQSGTTIDQYGQPYA